MQGFGLSACFNGKKGNAMDASLDYLVPAGFGEAEFVEKRSRFIGRVWHADAEPDALAHIADMREKHRDATHNVFAYSIRGGPTRYSDDGEPQGTSGQPALAVFQNGRINNVCCVVTRYYGGIPLGAGGLVRAYSRAAKMALDNAGLSMMRQWRIMLIPCPYAFYERIKTLISACGGIIESTEFGTEVMMEVLVPMAAALECARRVTDMSAGRIEAAVVDTVFRAGRIV